MTNLQLQFIKTCLSESNFNCEPLGLDDESWDDNRECQVMGNGLFASIVDVAEWSGWMKLTKNQIKGILGSLSDAGYISIEEDQDDDGKPMSWVYIDEDGWKKIKTDMAALVKAKPAVDKKVKAPAKKPAKSIEDKMKARVVTESENLTPDEIYDRLAKAGVDWKHCDNKGINLMRAKMAWKDALVNKVKV